MIQRKTLPPQLHTGRRPLKGRFEQARNYGSEGRHSGYMKPVGGMWTTTYETALTEGWPWWVLAEDFHVEQLDEAWLLEPVECNVIELAGFDQCHEFMVRYAKQLFSFDSGLRDNIILSDPDGVYARAYEHFDTPSMACPMWEDVMQDADCVRLLTPYAFNVRLGPYLFFNTWDCESTVWLRWKFKGAARRVSLDAMRNRMEEGAAA
jgi:hypothetical protein